MKKNPLYLLFFSLAAMSVAPSRTLTATMTQAGQRHREDRLPVDTANDTSPPPPSSRPKAKKSVPKIVWKSGKTTVEQPGKARISFSNRIQIRFTYALPEETEKLGSFRIRRAKSKLSGWIYHKSLTFKLQVDWASGELLEDALIDYDLSGNGVFQIRAGQFKVPFGHQELTSSGDLEFVDRSITSKEFAKGRDIGIDLHGRVMEGKLLYDLGFFNGAGVNIKENDNGNFQVDARLLFAPLGRFEFSEGDLKSRTSPLLAVGAQFETNDRRPGESRRTIYGGDVLFKYRGIASFAEAFFRTEEDDLGVELDSSGFHGQIGYFLLPGKFEIALRLAAIDPDTNAPNDRKTELGAALGWFFDRHRLKLQADFRQLKEETGLDSSVTDHEVRTQVQFVF